MRHIEYATLLFIFLICGSHLLEDAYEKIKQKPLEAHSVFYFTYSVLITLVSIVVAVTKDDSIEFNPDPDYILSIMSLCLFFYLFRSKNKAKQNKSLLRKYLWVFYLVLSVYLFVNAFFYPSQHYIFWP